MKPKKIQLTFAVLAVLVTAGIVASAAARQDATETGPVYSVEGSWSGIASLSGLPPIATMDTFIANAQKPAIDGSLLCTIPVMTFRHPDHPTDAQFWLTMTATAHGNWVRVGPNRYAYTAVRTLVDQNGLYFGRGRNWGVFTAVSDDEVTGTMTYQFYRADGTQFGRTITGTAHSNRLEITIEQDQ